ncbi:transcriptional regulator [Thermostilla marina]
MGQKHRTPRRRRRDLTASAAQGKLVQRIHGDLALLWKLLQRWEPPVADQSQLVRQWRLLRILGARRLGVSVKELAEELEVSEKTIRRDLDIIREVGFPVAEETEAHGRKRFKIASAQGVEISLNYEEALSLFVGRRLLETLAGTPFAEPARAAFQKIRSILSENAIRYVDNLADKFCETSVGLSDYRGKYEIVDALLLAIDEKKTVHITYQSLHATEPVTYDIRPYGLVRHRGSLYLVGHSNEHRDIRHWKVDRIYDIEVTRIPFTIPDSFNLKEHLEKQFGIYSGSDVEDVCVRFSPTVARYVMEKKWHPSQKLTQQKSGHVIAEFRLSGLPEFKSWILSFGRHAEVLRPASLREELIEEFKTLVAMYELDGAPSRPHRHDGPKRPHATG